MQLPLLRPLFHDPLPLQCGHNIWKPPKCNDDDAMHRNLTSERASRSPPPPRPFSCLAGISSVPLPILISDADGVTF